MATIIPIASIGPIEGAKGRPPPGTFLCSHRQYVDDLAAVLRDCGVSDLAGLAQCKYLHLAARSRGLTPYELALRRLAYG
jgi:hypothetical protein